MECPRHIISMSFPCHDHVIDLIYTITPILSINATIGTRSLCLWPRESFHHSKASSLQSKLWSPLPLMHAVKPLWSCFLEPTAFLIIWNSQLLGLRYFKFISCHIVSFFISCIMLCHDIISHRIISHHIVCHVVACIVYLAMTNFCDHIMTTSYILITPYLYCHAFLR